MTETAIEIDNPVSVVGFQVANQALIKIAERALELDDEQLLEQLEIIGYVITETEK